MNKPPAKTTKLRPPMSTEDFIGGAAANEPSQAVMAAAAGALSSRIPMREPGSIPLPDNIRVGWPAQINVTTTEDLRYLIKEHVATRPGRKMSVQDFIILAVKEKMVEEGVVFPQG